MTTELKGFINISSNVGVTFSNSLKSDLLFFTTSNTQRILMGTKQNQAASFAITSNSVIINENLGVGTSNPVHRLDVAGTIRAGTSGAATSLLLGTSTDTNGNRFISALDSNMTAGASRFISFGKANSTWNQAELMYTHNADGNASNMLSLGFHTAPVMHILPNGNVGVGTPAPTQRLDVAGTTLLRSGGNLWNTTNLDQILFGAGDILRHAVKSRHHRDEGATAGNGVDVFTWHPCDASNAIGTRHGMSITSAGVGLGTTWPGARLDVVPAYVHPPFANAPGYVTSASSSYSGTDAGFAIDYNPSSYWLAGDADSGQTVTNVGTFNNWWWQLRLPGPRVINGVQITTYNHGINRFVVAASGDNGNTWTVILNRNAAGTVAIAAAGVATTFTFDNATTHMHFRIIPTELPLNAYGKPILQEVRFLEAPPNSRALRVGTASGGDGFVVDWSGNSTFNGRLSMGTPQGPRMIALADGANDHQFYGFGISPSTLRYQVDATGAMHGFYAATSSNQSRELFRIQGDGTSRFRTGASNFLVVRDLPGTGPSLRAHDGGEALGVYRSMEFEASNIEFRAGGISHTHLIMSLRSDNDANVMQVLPGKDNAVTLGSATMRWSNVHCTNATVAQRLDVAGAIRAGSTGTTTSLLLGDSTEISSSWMRFISARDSTMSTNTSRAIVFGRDHSLNNQAEQAFFYAGNGSANNRLDFGFFGNSIMSLVAHGRLGLGMTAPTYQLDLSTDGARKLTSTSWLTGSDSRVKTDIEDADYSICYSNVKNIPLRRFAWDSNAYTDVPDRRVLGWIAQEVETVFPKAVRKSAERGLEDFRTLDVDQLYKTMWGALKKCIEVIESQDARIAALEAEPR